MKKTRNSKNVSKPVHQDTGEMLKPMNVLLVEKLMLIVSNVLLSAGVLNVKLQNTNMKENVLLLAQMVIMVTPIIIPVKNVTTLVVLVLEEITINFYIHR
jgi:hypothetical protein